MTDCGTFVAPPSFQLKKTAGKTGGYDCSAHAFVVVARQATCGKKLAEPTAGRKVRLMSSEPIPDPRSPGLNLAQIDDVAEKLGIPFQVFVGSRALTWAEYEAKRKAGQPAEIQVDYSVIALSQMDAFDDRFGGGHAMAETVNATYDPGADGRRPSVHKHDGRLYDRALMRRAAELLQIGTGVNGRPILAGPDRVFCAFAPDVVPNYRVSVQPRKGRKVRGFNTYTVKNGVITGSKPASTKGFTATARIRCVPWPARKATRYLVYITSGPRKGQWINAKWAKEV